MKKDSFIQKNSIIPFLLIIMLFFTWGFIWNFFNIIAAFFQEAFELSNTMLSLGTSISFLAFFVMPYPSKYIIRKYGIKKSITFGALTAGLGMLAVCFASFLKSYSPFLIGFFILFSGVTILQTVCNPYIGSLGKTTNRESRINFAQGIGAVGAALTAPVGGWFILQLFSNDIFGGIKLFALIIALLFFLLALFVSQSEIQSFSTELEKNQAGHSMITKKVFRFKHFKTGLIIMFLYMGAEAIIFQLMTPYFKETGFVGNIEAVMLSSFIFYGLVVGRLIGSWLMSKINPSKLLGISSLIASIMLLLSILIGGKTGIYLAASVGLFISINFATIFALSTDDLGKLTYDASSYLIMAISGGFFIPMIYGLIADFVSLLASLSIIIIIFLLCSIYGFTYNKLKSKYNAT